MLAKEIEDLKALNQKKDNLITAKDTLISTLVKNLRSLGKTNKEITDVTGLLVEEVNNM